TSTSAPVTPTTKAGSTPTTSGGGGSKAVTAASQSLAFTGPGPGIGMLSVIGAVLILLGLALLVLVDAPRRALAQLAAVGPSSWRRVRDGLHGNASTAGGRHFAQTSMAIAKRTGRWFLGR
ncbi:MAG TPA: hypothetical protein VII76_01550, partial [Acidimicrobiales bacterium]